MTESLPNFAETDLDDLWRFREEQHDAEAFHQERRKAADQELLKRAAERDAQILDTPWGPITIIFPSQYAYDTNAVDQVLWPLIERDGLQAEYRQFVHHNYKIDRRWLNRLLKRGAEYKDAVERVTVGSTGAPYVGSGPGLDEIGGYADDRAVAAEEGVTI